MIIGYLSADLMAGLGSAALESVLFVFPVNVEYINVEFVHPFIKNIPFFMSLTMIFITTFVLMYMNAVPTGMDDIYENIFYNFRFFNTFAAFSYHAGFFNTIYNKGFIATLKIYYTALTKYADRGVFEYLGPYGAYLSFYFVYDTLHSIWLTIIYYILLFIFVVICLFLLFVLLT